MKKSMWTLCLISVLGLALFPGCMTSASVAEDDDSRQVLEEEEESGNEENNENNNNQENNNEEAEAAAQQLLEDTAEDICEEMKACTDPICTQSIIEVASCKNQLLSSNYTQAELQSQLGLGCDVIIASMCTQQDVQAVCTCPEAAQGTCPEGQFCSVMLQGASGTSYACGDENGALPADAAVCTTETPCADEVNEICVATSAGATSGVCLLSCTQ
jgi:hypothetical protein